MDLDLPGGKTLTVTRSAKARHAKGTSARIGGKKAASYRITHDALVNAGTIRWQ